MSYFRYLYLTPNQSQRDWESMLKHSIMHNEVMRQPKEDLNSLINESTPRTIQDQFKFLSKLSNNAYTSYPLSGMSNKQSQHKPTLHQHLLYSPGNSTDPLGATCNDFAPTSFRQRTLHFLFFASRLDLFYAKKMIQKNLDCESFTDINTVNTPKECRRRIKRVLNTRTPLEDPALNLFTRDEFVRQYDDFAESVFTSGILIVRAFCSTGGFLIMNDYSASGYFIPYKFVNVRYAKDSDGDLIIKCTCSDFKKTAGMGADHFDLPSNDTKIRCMHTRLLYTKLQRSIKQIPHVRLFDCPRLQKQMIESCHSKANASVVVVQTGDLLVLSISKHPQSMPCFVTVDPKTQHMRCQGGCKNNYKTKRNKKQHYTLDEVDESKLCRHLRAVIAEEDLIHNYLSCNREKDNMKIEEEEFDTTTGKWKKKALGKHKPKQKTDPAYIR